MQLSYCVVTMITLVVAGSLTIMWRNWRINNLTKKLLHDEPNKILNEIDSVVKNLNKIKVKETFCVFATAVGLLITGAVGFSSSIEFVSCGDGQLAFIGKPIEVLVEAIGCECCGNHGIELAQKDE